MGLNMSQSNMCRTNLNLTPDNTNVGEDVFFVIRHTADGEIVSTDIEMQAYAKSASMTLFSDNSASISLSPEIFSIENLDRIIDTIISVKSFKY